LGTLNNGYIKKINQELIINEIRNRGVISRVNLAELLHLSIPGVSKNVKQLVNRNILIEMGEGESIGGRRPKLYSLNSNYRFIVGVDFSSEVIRIALVNMDGNILELNNLSRTKKRINIQTIKKMKDKINEMLSRNKVLNNQISVIVMGMQGIVNEVTGEIVTFNWFEDMQRIDNIAYTTLGDPALWWVIAQVNSIKNPLTDLTIGMTLKIPLIESIRIALS